MSICFRVVAVPVDKGDVLGDGTESILCAIFLLSGIPDKGVSKMSITAINDNFNETRKVMTC